LFLKKLPLKSGFEQHRTIALREPDLTEFSGKEIALVNEIIDYLREYDAEESSELSHQMVGWKVTEMDETIPYGTIFLSDEPLSSEELQRARQLVEIGNRRGLPVG
jgi:hypothetical protein